MARPFHPGGKSVDRPEATAMQLARNSRVVNRPNISSPGDRIASQEAKKIRTEKEKRGLRKSKRSQVIAQAGSTLAKFRNTCINQLNSDEVVVVR